MVERHPPREHVVVEVVRLGVVLAATAAGYALAEPLHGLLTFEDGSTTRLVSSLLGALAGDLLGGILGRQLVVTTEATTRRLTAIPAVQLVAGALGGALGALLGLAIAAPVLLLPAQRFTVPVLLLVVVASVYAGVLLGAARAAELSRFVGVRGRIDVRNPARGAGTKVVDSSALIDGRIAEVARTGYLEGTLIVPRFVIAEVERIAGDDREHRARLGQRGLATLQVLQDEGLVVVEIADEEVAGVAAVDDKLAALCRERGAALITADQGLARTAEASGIRVLNPHALADAVRSPVLPGDRIELRLVRGGKEPGQGIGYLEDGTMVIVERAEHLVDTEVAVEVTSMVQSRTGRLLFAGVAQGAA
ncbi:MAG: PIN/TRAM domain-containing protein [Nitriliruptoraceae bacterium]